MLVLSRALDQSIIINGNIKIKILEIRTGGNVRLGISAPKDVSIHREEIQAKVDARAAEGVEPGAAEGGAS